MRRPHCVADGLLDPGLFQHVPLRDDQVGRHFIFPLCLVRHDPHTPFFSTPTRDAKGTQVREFSYSLFAESLSSLTRLHAYLNDLHHDELVGIVHGKQRRIWFEQPALDRLLGKLNRHPPSRLEVIYSISRKLVVADGVDSYPPFWQYADSGTFPGDQDLFNGDAAGLSRYVSQWICLPVLAKINRRSSLGWLWVHKMIGPFKTESKGGVGILLVKCYLP